MSRLKEQYENEIKDAMIKKFGYKNTMEVPKLDKIVVNMGVGAAFGVFLYCFAVDVRRLCLRRRFFYRGYGRGS